MKRTILLAFVIFLTLAGQSQTRTGRVSGTVIDGNARTIEASTITLLRASDSSIVKLGVATREGKFVFENLADGRYLVSISAVGHLKGFSESFEIGSANKDITLKTIELIPAAKSLGAVTVTSKKPLIEQKIDRTVVNVEAAITNVGSSALEVLEKSPGITVDKDGNISLKGKQGVQIYIDGRPAYLSGQDLANYLRNLNASQLDQIEIMTNPPARYDASGNSGVINIKTKKNKQFGYNGSVSVGYTQGYYPRVNESVNFNYRNGKVNLFTNLSHSFNKRYEVLDIQRNFIDDQTKLLETRYEQTSRMRNRNSFYNGKVGLDYSASKKTTFGVVLSGFVNPRLWTSQTATDISDPDGFLRERVQADALNDARWKHFGTNVNFRHQLDSTGQEITADLDFLRYNSTSDQSLISRRFDPSGNPLFFDTLLTTMPQSIKIYSGRIDYTLPLKNDSKFEAGVKTSYVETDNDAVYNNLVDGHQLLDSARYNHFIYEEQINAAYVNYNRPITKKLSAQLGLRLENTISKGNSTGYSYDTVENRFETSVAKLDRNYTQLFPTVYLQYKLSEKHTLGANYGRRIERPDYEDLNPFVHFLDRYTYEQGNPNLKPQFAHNFELQHIFDGFLTTTVNYTSTKDIIQQVLEQHDSTNETFIKKANIAKLQQIGIALSAHKQINKWWSGNIYVNLFNNRFEGVVNGTDEIKLSITSLMLQGQQQFKFGKGWGAEVSGFFRTKGLEGVLFIKPVGSINFGFSKQVLNNKGTIRLNVRDAFDFQRFKGYSKYGTVDAQFQDYNYARSVTLNFTYRFSKGKVGNNNQRKNGSAQDEKNRVNVGE